MGNIEKHRSQWTVHSEQMNVNSLRNTELQHKFHRERDIGKIETIMADQCRVSKRTWESNLCS